MKRQLIYMALLSFVLAGVFSYQKVIVSTSQVSPVTQLVDYGGLANFDPEVKKRHVFYKRSYRYGPNDNEKRIIKSLDNIHKKEDRLVSEYNTSLAALNSQNTWERIVADTSKFAAMMYSEIMALLSTRPEFEESVNDITAALQETDPDVRKAMLEAYVDKQNPFVKDFLKRDPLFENVGLKPLKNKVDSSFQQETSKMVSATQLNFMLLNAPHKELLQEQKNLDINRQIIAQRYRASDARRAQANFKDVQRRRQDQFRLQKLRLELLQQRINQLRESLKVRISH